MNPFYPAGDRRAGHRCEYCRAPEGLFNLPFEVEHVCPTSRGGADDETNLALACRSCNLHKSDHVSGTDPESAAAVRLYDPRSDRWDDHFRVDLDRGELYARTPIGRATVDRLRINDPAQVLARQLWIKLRLFP
jgi:hypothetical protein